MSAWDIVQVVGITEDRCVSLSSTSEDDETTPTTTDKIREIMKRKVRHDIYFSLLRKGFRLEDEKG
jgi:hypothetical protein